MSRIVGKSILIHIDDFISFEEPCSYCERAGIDFMKKTIHKKHKYINIINDIWDYFLVRETISYRTNKVSSNQRRHDSLTFRGRNWSKQIMYFSLSLIFLFVSISLFHPLYLYPSSLPLSVYPSTFLSLSQYTLFFVLGYRWRF